MSTGHRQLYRIGYLTEHLNITPRTIRYYDKLGLFPDAKRSDGDTRLFDDNDIKRIQTIRDLQKKERIPLDTIRHKLLPKTLKQESILLITDAYSKQQLYFDSQLHILPRSDTLPIQEQVTQAITSLPLSAHSVPIFFYHESQQLFYTHLKHALDQPALFYPLKYLGLSGCMICDYIRHHGASLLNKALLDQTILRMIDLSVTLAFLDNIGTYYPTQPAHPNQEMAPLMNRFSPILVSSNHGQNIASFQSSTTTALPHLLDRFDEEWHQRKRYVTNIAVFHIKQETMARKLCHYIQDIMPRIAVSCTPIINWPLAEKRAVMLTLI